MNIADIAVIVNGGSGGGGGGGGGDVIYLIPKQTITITDAPVPITAENFDKAAELNINAAAVEVAFDGEATIFCAPYFDDYGGIDGAFEHASQNLAISVFDNNGEWAFVLYDPDTQEIIPATLTIAAAVTIL